MPHCAHKPQWLWCECGVSIYHLSSYKWILITSSKLDQASSFHPFLFVCSCAVFHISPFLTQMEMVTASQEMVWKWRINKGYSCPINLCTSVCILVGSGEFSLQTEPWKTCNVSSVAKKPTGKCSLHNIWLNHEGRFFFWHEKQLAGYRWFSPLHRQMECLPPAFILVPLLTHLTPVKEARET